MKIILRIFSRNFLIRISYYLVPILKIVYSGKRFIDPIDGKGYSKFLSYGYTKLRKNALCPGTLSLERHRLLWLYLNKRTNLLNSKLKVLHIAPEQIFYRKFKKNIYWDYTTFDLKSPMADIIGDITKLNFKNNTFDLIICNHVLEHIIDDRTAMNEIYRVLKKDGIGILQVPIDKCLEKTYEDNTLVSKKLNRAATLRYFNPIGAHHSGLIGELPLGTPNNLVPFITQTAAGIIENLTVFGNDYNTIDGTCVRDYIHVMDLAEAHVRSLQTMELNEKSFTLNIGTGKGSSVLEVIQAFEKVNHTKLNYKIGAKREGDIEQIYAETTLSETTLAWKTKRTLEDAMRDAWKWQLYIQNKQ